MQLYVFIKNVFLRCKINAFILLAFLHLQERGEEIGISRTNEEILKRLYKLNNKVVSYTFINGYKLPVYLY